MKIKMKQLKRLLLLFTMAGALITSCRSNTSVVSPTRIMTTVETKVATATLTPSPEFLLVTKLWTSKSENSQILLFDDWPKDGFSTDAAKITAITLEKNILKIQVVYQGGCQEHTFELHAWTGFLLSNPPQGELYLSHDSHGDICTGNVEDLLSFDLTPLDQSRAGRQAHPLLLRIYEPAGESFANEPYRPLIEWP